MKAYTWFTLALALVIAALGSAADLWAAEHHRQRGEHPQNRARLLSTDDPININTATVAELEKLKGIGRHVAKRIVEYRDAHGEFKKPEDIRKVEGVGKSLWEANRDRITVR